MLLPKINTDSLIVCPNDLKEIILSSFNIEKSIKPVTFVDLEAYKKRYYFDYDYKAIKYLMDNYSYTLNNAKEIIDNLYFIEDKQYENNELNKLVNIKNALFKNKLLIKDPLFKEQIKNKKIIVTGYGKLEKFYSRMLANALFINKEIINKHYDIKEFKVIEDEVFYLYEAISNLIKQGTDINNIYVIASSDYQNLIKRYNSYYDFKIIYPSDNSLYGTELAKRFLNDITYKDRETIYNELINDNNEYTNILIKILNKYLDLSCAFEFIKEDLKQTKLNKQYTNVVNVVSYNYPFKEKDHVFYLGFNDKVPTYKRNDSYLDDDLSLILGLDDTNSKNQIIKENIIVKLSNIDHLYLSYCINTPFNKYDKQMLLDDVSYLKSHNKYYYSDKANKNRYGELLDNLEKYGELNKSLPCFYATYDKNDYGTYDNAYKTYNLGKKEVELSYSSMQAYYECAFKYYLDYILKPDATDTTFFNTIGSTAHYVLQEMTLDPNKDFDALWESKTCFDSAKELFFSQKIKEEIKEDYKIILKQKGKSLFNNVACEQRIKVKLNNRVFFEGRIDKILKYNDNICIIDYKTGNSTIDDKLFGLGLSLQLPSYLFLLKESNKYKKANIIGFYLQCLLTSKYIYDDKKDIACQKEEDLKLIGYTIDDLGLIEILEKVENKSTVVKSLSIKKDGNFAKDSKVISNKQMDEMIILVKDKIKEASLNILNSNFDINPKVVNNDNKSCTYCKYKDICYKKEKDNIYIELKQETKDGN